MSIKSVLLFCLLFSVLGCQPKEIEKITTRVQDIPEYSSLKDMDSAPEKIRARSQGIIKIDDTLGRVGTAFFVNDQGMLMTNNHVLGSENCARTGCFARIFKNFEVGSQYQDPEIVFAIPLLVDVSLDMSLFQIKRVSSAGGRERKMGVNYSSPHHLTFRPASSQDLVGETMYIVGHPVGGLKKWTEGVGLRARGNWVLTDHFVLPGNSGSPVLDVEGRIVGLLHRTMRSTESITRHDIQATSFFSASQAILDSMGLTDVGKDTSITILQSKLRPKSDHLLLMKNLDEVTKEQFVEGHLLFLGSGRTPKFDVEAYADLFSADCDQELDNSFYGNVEDHFSALARRCLSATEWMACDKSSTPWSSARSGDLKWCPSETKRSQWIARFTKIMSHFRELNADDVLLARIYLDLFSTLTTTKRSDLFDAFIKEAGLQLSVGLALLKINASSKRSELYINSVSLLTYIKGYREIANFERDYFNLIGAMIGLYRFNEIEAKLIQQTLNEALQSSEVTLEQKLLLEVVAYKLQML